MKIAFLSFYSGTVNRGAESFVDGLAEKLSSKHEVVVFQEGESIGNQAGYKTKRILMQMNWAKEDMTGTIWRRFFIDYWSIKIAIFTLKVLPSIIRQKYDVVIAINGGWQPAFLRLATWIYGGKLVITGQSGMGWDDRNNLWCFPDYFIALSRKAQKWARKAMPLVPSEYIPNGVDLKKFTPNGESFASGLKKPIILCVGALVEQKRIDLVIQAVAKLKGVSLLVVGDGELKEKLTEMGKKLLGSRFHLIKISFEDMPEVYRCADVFSLVPESSEAFGVVFVEALAANLPVVTIDDEQRKEIIGEAGFFVKPANTGQYAKALREAIDYDWEDKPRKQAEKFDWDGTTERYEKLFKKLIRK